MPEYKTANSQVVIAAERFSFLGGAGGLKGIWASEQIKSGYLGESYMRSSLEVPGDGSHLLFDPETANLNYVIDFKETGTYYLHLRTLAMEHDENGFFATLDGKEINYGGVNPATGLTASFIYVEKTGLWNWYTDGGGTEGRGLKVSFNVTTPGKHTFTLYRRDTGSRVDHIWLTKTDSTPNNTATLNLPDPGLFVVK